MCLSLFPTAPRVSFEGGVGCDLCICAGFAEGFGRSWCVVLRTEGDSLVKPSRSPQFAGPRAVDFSSHALIPGSLRLILSWS